MHTFFFKLLNDLIYCTKVVIISFCYCFSWVVSLLASVILINLPPGLMKPPLSPAMLGK